MCFLIKITVVEKYRDFLKQPPSQYCPDWLRFWRAALAKDVWRGQLDPVNFIRIGIQKKSFSE
jgi:hypothetical protein